VDVRVGFFSRIMDAKGRRMTFTQRHWETLQDIVIHAEGGKFMRALVVRDNARYEVCPDDFRKTAI
jgi:hypothetical protein